MSTSELASASEAPKPLPAPFLTKTYQFVDDPNVDDIVSWGTESNSFVVWKPIEFAQEILPNYFKHSNFASFVRQLNTYGFRKTGSDKWEFANDLFQKGAKELLCEIQRRKSAVPQTAEKENQGPSNKPARDESLSPSPSISPQKLANTKLEVVIEENKRLKLDCARMASELEKMHQLYVDAVNSFHHQMHSFAEHMPPFLWAGNHWGYQLPPSYSFPTFPPSPYPVESVEMGKEFCRKRKSPELGDSSDSLACSPSLVPCVGGHVIKPVPRLWSPEIKSSIASLSEETE